MEIVSGTLGEQQCVALCAGEPSSTSVVGQVQALESGAYLIRTPMVRKSEFRMTRLLGLTNRPMWATPFNPGSITMVAVLIRSLDGMVNSICQIPPQSALPRKNRIASIAEFLQS